MTAGEPFKPAIVPREIVTHAVYGKPESLTIIATDSPLNNRYEVRGMNASNPSQQPAESDIRTAVVMFQNGTEPEVGVNGVTIESLLAICADRIAGWQSGPWACRENALALTHMQEAMGWLQRRTVDRLRRNVEGTHTV